MFVHGALASTETAIHRYNLNLTKCTGLTVDNNETKYTTYHEARIQGDTLIEMSYLQT